MCNGNSGGISLKFNKFPEISPISTNYPHLLFVQPGLCHSCPHKSQLLHSPQTLLPLKQKNCCVQGMLIRDNIFRFPSTLIILFKIMFFVLPKFSGSPNFVTLFPQNMGHSVSLRVFNIKFSSSLNISILPLNPKPGVLSSITLHCALL